MTKSESERRLEPKGGTRKKRMQGGCGSSWRPGRYATTGTISARGSQKRISSEGRQRKVSFWGGVAGYPITNISRGGTGKIGAEIKKVVRRMIKSLQCRPSNRRCPSVLKNGARNLAGR